MVLKTIQNIQVPYFSMVMQPFYQARSPLTSRTGRNNLYVQVMQEILFKLSGAVAADKGVDQRARYKAGV